MNIVELSLNMGSLITGAKVGKRIENYKKSRIIEILAKKIASVCTKMSEQEIANELNKNDMKYLINKTGRFGICPMRNISLFYKKHVFKRRLC